MKKTFTSLKSNKIQTNTKHKNPEKHNYFKNNIIRTVLSFFLQGKHTITMWLHCNISNVSEVNWGEGLPVGCHMYKGKCQGSSSPSPGLRAPAGSPPGSS